VLSVLCYVSKYILGDNYVKGGNDADECLVLIAWQKPVGQWECLVVKAVLAVYTRRARIVHK
jgi:hypothetical protein